ncbi:hypothetical protein XENOCAPTIV_001180 [Xenoophorus captivus]|uniref:Kinesin motor domain-containing protein n=1 Tax=Xenoophorus captivus TaxID=1517983 RepID=A0ABV0Q805_9TELE
MIATVSPAADNYEETLSTLRYADRAKRIVNHAVVNEDPNARIIRELREEVEKLRVQLSQAEVRCGPSQILVPFSNHQKSCSDCFFSLTAILQSMKAPELKEKLQESEKLIQEMTVTWEEKLRKTEEIATEHTRVGADTSQDIQLFGIGIQPEHCVLELCPEGDVTLMPIGNARTCVNGAVVDSLVHLWHGDRILWGNNHFFRYESFTVIQMLTVLEKQYLEEKRTALEEQRLMYERELESLRQQLTPEKTQQYHRNSSERLSYPTHTPHGKLRLWTEEREQVVKANTLVREANFLAEEMNKLTDYQVTLQIPAANLSANRKVAGRLHVDLMRVSGSAPERLSGGDDSSENSSESSCYEVMDTNGEIVRIKEATGLPLNLSNFVFCQYNFWEHGEPTVAPPMVSPDTPSPRSPDSQFTVQFDHCKVSVKPVQNSGTLPLLVEAVLSVSIGCVSARSTKLQRPLDSYQEEDLNCVRQRWSDALIKRREYLDEQIKKIINKHEKSEEDVEREARLVEQWVGLTEERNAVLVPAAGSGIPGAPADCFLFGFPKFKPSFMLPADNLTVNEQLTGPHTAGVNSILPKEHGSQFFYLPIIRHNNEERIYLIIKATVQLSHPASMELVLRKRIAVNIYNKQVRSGTESSTFFSASPFKVLSPQPPKFLKSLLPVKEENKAKKTLEARPLLGLEHDSEEEDTDVSLNLNRCPMDQSSFQSYIPEDFANFEIYNATLESLDRFRTDSKGSRCGGGSGDREVSRSPTASSCTSGYFSHSESNATLSDVPFSTSESSDHLSCASREFHDPAGRSSAQTKSVSAGSIGDQPLSARGGPEQFIHPSSPPVSIPNCTDKQHTVPLPHNCILSTSQEFTDFKGADDSIREGDLAHFTEEWGQSGLELSTNHQKEPELVKTCDNQLSSDPENVICRCPNYENPVSITVSCSNTKVPSTSLNAPISAPDRGLLLSSSSKDPFPSLPPPASAIKPLPTAQSSGPAQRAGGEPPIQEPAQGDLPHGSPCPSPNPSSAEPSGDSSGDESSPVAQLPDWMAPGEQVWVGKRRGTVYYVGGVEFAKGIWIGVKLDLAVGK